MLLENHFMLLLLLLLPQSLLSSFPVEVVFARRWCFVRYRCSLACRRFLRLPSKLFLLVVVVVLASRFGRFSLCASACSRRGSCGAWSAFCWSVFIVAAGWLLMVVAGVVRHVLVVPFLAGCHSLRFRLSKNARARKGGRLAGQESRTGRGGGDDFSARG